MEYIKVQWHRDRIDQLKHEISLLLWKLTALLTGLIGIMSIFYLIWYNQKDTFTRLVLVLVSIIFICGTWIKVKGYTSNITKFNKKIARNYHILLGQNGYSMLLT